MTEESDEQQAAIGINTLIHMDDPQHRVVRTIGGNGSARRPCGR